MSYQELKTKIMNDPAASYWLQNAIKALDKRDPVDAIADVETLVKVCNKRYLTYCNPGI